MYTQYIPTDSPIHRLSAILKLYGLTGFILLSFLIKSLPAAVVYLLSAIGLLIISRLPVKAVLRKIRHAGVLLICGLILNLIFSDWQEAVTIFLRLSAIVITAQTVIMSTPGHELIDGLERGFRLKSEYTISILIAVAFIPILESTWKEIVMAQSARGYDWNECAIRKKLSGAASLFIPLFRFSVKKAEILGEALTMKAYSSR